jgi:hypothetical protein
MSRATATALTVVRVAHGAPAPSDADLRAALERDRLRLHLDPQAAICDYAVAGPYTMEVDGQQVDEYVVWER